MTTMAAAEMMNRRKGTSNHGMASVAALWERGGIERGAREGPSASERSRGHSAARRPGRYFDADTLLTPAIKGVGHIAACLLWLAEPRRTLPYCTGIGVFM